MSMATPDEPPERVHGDLDAAREVIAAREAELDRAQRLAARLVFEIARLRRVEAATARQRVRRCLHRALGPRGYEWGKRLYRWVRRLPPPAEAAAGGAPPSQLPVVDGQPLVTFLACPWCGETPLREGPGTLRCPGCPATFPVVEGTPVFTGMPLERVLRRSLGPVPNGHELAERLYRVLDFSGVIRWPPAFTPLIERAGATPPRSMSAEHPPRLPLPGPRRAGVGRLLFLTHNLSLEGASIFLLSLATALPRDRYEIWVLSPVDGPLRTRYEADGIVVSLVEVLGRAGSRPEYEALTTGLARWLRVGDFDLVFCNTLVAFWGVAAARLAERPSVWKIHESVDWRAYFTALAEPLTADAIDCLRAASRLTFTADATRALFREFDAPGRVRTIHCGIDVGAIEAFARAGGRSALRAAHGVKDGDRIVSVIGTTCERKGQLDFLHMAAALRAGRPETLHFYVVGARDGEYLDTLKQFALDANLDSVVFIPETPHVYDFYLMTDIFVCPSYRESFPLVVLEAMAFGLPIVATAVFGIPEALTHDQDALLTEPGDVEGLTAAVNRLLDDPALATRLAESARATIRRRFTLDRMAREYDRLFTELTARRADPGRILSDSPQAPDGVR